MLSYYGGVGSLIHNKDLKVEQQKTASWTKIAGLGGGIGGMVYVQLRELFHKVMMELSLV